MYKRKRVVFGLLLLLILFFIFKGGSMHWIRAPYYRISDIEGDDFETNALLKTESGHGYLGGFIFNSDVDFKEPNYKLNESIHKALIQKTDDNWKTRQTVFEGNGEIQDFFNIGNGNIIARNTQVDKESLRYSDQFLSMNDSVGKELSRLNFMVTDIYGSGSPWILVIGFSQEKDSTLSFVTSDGAGSWYPVDMRGFNPKVGTSGFGMIFSNVGKLFRFSLTKLDFIDFSNPAMSSTWNFIAKSPQPITYPAFVLLDQSIKVIGTLSDSSMGLWDMRFDGKGQNSIQVCTGIPKDFHIDKFIRRGEILYLIGSVLVYRNGEARGIEMYLLRSDQGGTIWTNLHLPITSGINGIDFGEEGSIWVSAPGNRIQVYQGDVKN